MTQWKETSKVQVRIYNGMWHIIWPVPMQYRLTGKRVTVVPTYKEAIRVACRLLIFYQWKL